jgi:hypothetical protein
MEDSICLCCITLGLDLLSFDLLWLHPDWFLLVIGLFILL